jgi:hypothetical protein
MMAADPSRDLLELHRQATAWASITSSVKVEQRDIIFAPQHRNNGCDSKSLAWFDFFRLPSRWYQPPHLSGCVGDVN